MMNEGLGKKSILTDFFYILIKIDTAPQVYRIVEVRAGAQIPVVEKKIVNISFTIKRVKKKQKSYFVREKEVD